MARISARVGVAMLISLCACSRPVRLSCRRAQVGFLADFSCSSQAEISADEVAEEMIVSEPNARISEAFRDGPSEESP